MKKGIFILIVLTLLSFNNWQPTSKVKAATNSVTISSDGINIRTGPGLSYPVLKKVEKGEQYPVNKTQGQWIEIQLSNHTTGWVANWVVTEKNSSTEQQFVTTNGLRLRSEPAMSASVLSVLNKNDKVTVSTTRGEWSEVSINGLDGWIYSKYLTGQSTQKATATNNSSSEATVLVDNLNVRHSPNEDSNIVGKLRKATTVTVIDTKNGWLNVRYENISGWISGVYATSTNTNADQQPQKEEKKSSNLYGSVSVDALNVRSSQSLNGNVIASVKNGESFKILAQNQDWYHIQLNNGKTGWVASWYVTTTTKTASNKKNTANKTKTISIVYDGTNLRSSPSTSASIVQTTSAGDNFSVVAEENSWYKVALANGRFAYVASWVVKEANEKTVTTAHKESTNDTSSSKTPTVVLDAGHGGRDSGTIGYAGTYEKNITLKSIDMLATKLKNAGVHVIKTRDTDNYVTLSNRVAMANANNADAFISIHYDSDALSSVSGYTVYYYHDYQKKLATDIHNQITKTGTMRDRGIKFGNFHVIRENNQPAVLLELGYLSNPNDEVTILSKNYQDNVTTNVYNGIMDYLNQ